MHHIYTQETSGNTEMDDGALEVSQSDDRTPGSLEVNPENEELKASSGSITDGQPLTQAERDRIEQNRRRALELHRTRVVRYDGYVVQYFTSDFCVWFLIVSGRSISQIQPKSDQVCNGSVGANLGRILVQVAPVMQLDERPRLGLHSHKIVQQLSWLTLTFDRSFVGTSQIGHLWLMGIVVDLAYTRASRVRFPRRWTTSCVSIILETPQTLKTH